MKQTIAIEPNLNPIKDFLTSKGYSVESMDIKGDSNKKMDRFDAFIVTGMNTNLMGIQDTATRAVVIDASGMSPEQVYHELQLRLQ